MNTQIAIVMYHYVRPIADSKYPGIRGLELALFEQQLQYFEEEFHVITMQEVIDAIYQNATLPERAMLLTFDDGYSDHYQYAYPLLKKMGMQGSFFVPSGVIKEQTVMNANKLHFILAVSDINELTEEIFALLNQYRNEGYEIESNNDLFGKLAVAHRWDNKEIIFVKRLLQTYLPESLRNQIADRLFAEKIGMSETEFSKELYMNVEQMKEMRDNGMFFGLHGEAHYWLNHVAEEVMKRDIDNGISFFKDLVPANAMVMNYPYGGYNDKVISYVKQIGCKVGLATEAKMADIQKDNPFMLPRFDTNDFYPKSKRWRELE